MSSLCAEKQSTTNCELDEAFAYTRKLTYGHYENFPVASWLVPKNLRQHVCNIYAFARTADDFADEAEFAGERMDLLEQWKSELHRAALSAIEERPSANPLGRTGAWGVREQGSLGREGQLIFTALAHTLREKQLSVSLLNDLITAFMIDVKKARYAQFGEVMHYCRHSANPVGRLILELFGYGNEQWFTWSDHICTALQLANFWQDVAVDLKKDRIYLPQDELVRFGVTEAQLFAREDSPGLRELIKFQVERTRSMFEQGRVLCTTVPHPRLCWELKLTWLGGMRILEKIEANDYNCFKRPTVGKCDVPLLLWRASRWNT